MRRGGRSRNHRRAARCIALRIGLLVRHAHEDLEIAVERHLGLAAGLDQRAAGLVQHDSGSANLILRVQRREQIDARVEKRPPRSPTALLSLSK